MKKEKLTRAEIINNKEKLIIENFKPVCQKLGILTEEEAVASDGGYYNKPDNKTIVSRDEAIFINKIIEEFKNNIINPETPIIVNNTAKGKINLKIIMDLIENWNINFEIDNEEQGVSYFWLNPNQDIKTVMGALELADQIFYDKIV